MKSISYLVLFLFLMSAMACNSGSEKAVINGDTVISHSEAEGPIAKTVAQLTITGMTCSEGCGGKIQQELRLLQGVAGTELDFIDDRKANVVSVEYDPNTITENRLIECVNAIADGQYHVIEMEVISYKASANSNSASVSSEKESGLYDFGKVFQVLNLLQSLTHLVE